MTTTTVNRRALLAGAVTIPVAAYLIGTAHAQSADAVTPAVVMAPSSTHSASANGSAGAAIAATGGITVTGTGTVAGVPDALTLMMSTNVTSASIDDALARSNATAKAIVDALTTRGVAHADIQTTNLSIQPNYTGSGTPNGYVVAQSITAKVRGLSTAGGTVSAAIAAGGNDARVDGVTMSIDDTDPLTDSARAAAIQDARRHAEKFAQAAGVHVGQVLSISEDVTQTQPMPLWSGSMATDSKGGSVPIQAGTQDVTIQVTVVYALA